MNARDYREIAIREGGESLVLLPPSLLHVEPHPYACLGAPYGSLSPFRLRSDVLRRLLRAQEHLQRRADLRLLVFDAYRPVAVQQFMVDWTYAKLVREAGLDGAALDTDRREQFYEQVHRFWAQPSLDPSRPPPHSTGAAVDLTLATGAGDAIEMGGEIDEISERSYPEHYAHSRSELAHHYHNNRTLLRTALTAAGFEQHPREWWHFSFGDQMWALAGGHPAARYGRVQ